MSQYFMNKVFIKEKERIAIQYQQPWRATCSQRQQEVARSFFYRREEEEKRRGCYDHRVLVNIEFLL